MKLLKTALTHCKTGFGWWNLELYLKVFGHLQEKADEHEESTGAAHYENYVWTIA